MPAISVVMITYNEEEILPHSLPRLHWADEIIVVDSNSGDRTREIAAAAGAKVFARAFTNFADQTNWAIAQATGDWILIIDADELVTPELADSIRRTVRENPPADVFALRIDTFLFGRMMRSSPWSKVWALRLFRRGVARYEGAVHQNPRIGDRPVGRLDGILLHVTCRSVGKLFEKHQLYSTLWAEKARAEGRRTGIPKALCASVWRLFHNYFVRGEIKDGTIGFVCSILACAHTFTRHIKLWGLQNAERFGRIPGHDKEERHEVEENAVSWNDRI